MRFESFIKSLANIATQNELYEIGKSSWKADLNEFSDQTEEELKNNMGFIHEFIQQDIYS